MCAKIVTVLNRKGGVGKTTLTIAIADTLIAEKKADVTIVDLDPQATASQVLLTENDFKARVENHENLPGLLVALLRPAGELDNLRFRMDGLGKIRRQNRDRLRLYPNSDAFWDLEAEEIANDNGSRLNDALKNLLQQEKRDRQYILIDCPPGQSITAKAVLEASDLVICPMNADEYSLWGKDLLKRYISRVAPGTRYKFIINRFDNRLNVHKEVADKLRQPPHKADMLNIVQGLLFGSKPELAAFDVNASVMRRLDMTAQSFLDKIYGRKGAKQLKSIVEGMQKELGQDG